MWFDNEYSKRGNSLIMSIIKVILKNRITLIISLSGDNFDLMFRQHVQNLTFSRCFMS